MQFDITITPHSLAVVEPRCEQVISQLLRYDEIGFSTSSGKVRGQTTTKRAYATLYRNRMSIAIGSVPRVADYLRRRGDQVTINDLRCFNTPCFALATDNGVLADLRFPNLYQAMSQDNEGILEVPRGRQRAVVAGVISAFLEKSRILIVCTTVKETRMMAAGISNYVGTDVAAVNGGTWCSPCRVVCGTYRSYARAEPNDWNVLIYADARHALCEEGVGWRRFFSRHRVYAFLDPRCELSQKDQIQLEILAGPIIYSSQRRERGEVEVVFAPVKEEHLPVFADPRRQRERLWFQAARNKVIVQVAEGFAQRDPGKLWEADILTSLPDPFTGWHFGPHVVIVTQSVEHARLLSKKLPGWQLLDSLPQPPKQTQNLEWSQWLVPNRSIVTAVRAAQYKSFNADVVIMAAGGPYPQLPRGLARSNGKILLVDFADGGDRSCDEDTNRRREVYRTLGCSVRET